MQALAPGGGVAGVAEPNSTGGFPLVGAWHLLHTKSRQEKQLAGELSQMGISHFLPLGKHTRLYGKRRAVVELPLFPGYVFVRGSLDDAYQSARTRRVARVIEVVNQSRLNWELANLHLALQNRVALDPYPFLRQGMRVEVRSGPLRGLQGLIEQRLPSKHLILEVEMLGRALSVQVHGATLEPV